MYLSTKNYFIYDIFKNNHTNRKVIDLSDTCIYGVAAIDVLYRVTAILPCPKITVICALLEF
mgnify:CR=1 FL=1